jgi:hypothetical protein
VAFWDASAVAPLCVRQRSTSQVRRILREHSRLVVWWGTSVEVRSALARLAFEGTLSAEELRQAREGLDRVRRTWAEVVPTEQLRRLAEPLPDAHRIRAADALQLAAALVWCRERPRRRPFVCFDDRLAEAAEQIGFSVVGARAGAARRRDTSI